MRISSSKVLTRTAGMFGSSRWSGAIVSLFVVGLLSPAVLSAQQWRLKWSDEFNGAAGSLPDATKWTYDLGGGGWGNQELEVYTKDPANVHQDGNGNLVIRAIKSGNSYTSARILTKGLYTPQYGKIEARIKIPYGQGIWPAFWMLGANITDGVNWPACGEVDIMENIGREPTTVHATVHGPGYSGGNGIGRPYSTPNNARFADDFHTYSVVWQQDSLEFFVDGNSYHKVTPSTIPSGTQWVYNHPFFLILNVAVGGGWPGYPDATTTFPQDMTVDYVRVYEATNSPGIHAGGVVNGASFQTAVAPGSLATAFGVLLSDDTQTNTWDATANVFKNSASNAQVLVNGVAAPLTYVSPTQINFQIPWETPVGTPVDVVVNHGGTTTNTQSITLTPTAPSAFTSDGTVAILSCPHASPKAGDVCTLWGNGFGSVGGFSTNGVGFTSVEQTSAHCSLTIAGVDAHISYCGTAPHYILNQLNFTYPTLVGSGPTVPATLTIGDQTGSLTLPSPAS